MSRYRYAIELFKNGTSLGQAPVDIDWVPASEWVHFACIRAGELPPVMSAGPRVVEPIWHSDLGEPYVRGFRVVVSDDDGRQATREIPTTFLRQHATRASARFVESGALRPGDPFEYYTLAFLCDAPPAAASSEPPRFSIREVPQPLCLLETSLELLSRESKPFGDAHPDDMPVFLPRQVLDEAAMLTRQASPNETGGVLIGHLHRDAGAHEIFAEITAQIPARFTQATPRRLTFTADTWSAVQAAIDLRREDEIYIGWWHSHSYMKDMCKICAKYKDGTCNVSVTFMSSEDCALHRAVFPRAYSVALVMGDRPGAGLTWKLFGWRFCMIVARGFSILEAPVLAACVGAAGRATTTRGGKKDVTT